MFQDIIYNIMETCSCYPWIKEKAEYEMCIYIVEMISNTLKIHIFFKLEENVSKC